MGLRDLRWPTNLGFPAVIQKVKSEGVLTPLLWMCGLSFIATLVSAYLQHPIVWLFGVIDLGSAAYVFRGFDYFKVNNPMLMQSEKLQIEMAKHQKILADQALPEAKIVDANPVTNQNIAIADQRGDTNV